MSETHCHCRPEPIEAPEPTAFRVHDQTRRRALLHGYNTHQALEPGVVSYHAFVAAVEAVEAYMARYGRDL